MAIIPSITMNYSTEHGEAPASMKWTAGETLTTTHLPTLTADGYLHVGWYSTSTFDPDTEYQVGDTFDTQFSTLYAKWVDEVVVSVSSLQGIGNAIRTKNGTTTQYKPGEMEAAIEAIASSGSSVVTDTVTVPAFDSITIECENPQYAVVGYNNNAVIVGIGETVSGSDNNLTASLTETALTITNEVSMNLNNIKYYIFSEGGSGSGGGSGGSVETCTVTIEPYQWGSDENIKFTTATVVNNGAVTTYQFYPSSLYREVLTIENVLCGSTITIGLGIYNKYNPYVEVGGGATLIGTYFTNDKYMLYAVVQAPTTQGAIGTVGFSYEP